ncbi:MAG: hypothetical protein LBF82_00840 [Lactobacillales bacterium]|jgi:hypothetical protein|nr:hypothetical protein [Lactobacillales bacterium]
MKTLLEQDFVTYYNKNKESPVVANVSVRATQADYFELKDDESLVYSKGQGVAKYDNPSRCNVSVINYEDFVKSLPNRVKNAVAVGRDICDLIVYSNEHFLLNELTDTKPDYIPKKRIKARSQLLQTLQIILKVQSINQFANTHPVKQCCFFSQQPQTKLPDINVTVAFNRQNAYSHGFKTVNRDIENYGFEFWEFYATQTYLLSV